MESEVFTLVACVIGFVGFGALSLYCFLGKPRLLGLGVVSVLASVWWGTVMVLMLVFEFGGVS